ncbi:MAG: LacI family DNA-binding transcriptional regulator [Chthoniobacteraceae bacterium]
MNIVEFAKIAGLSTATISRAFHEPDKIRPETRKRVLELADQHGYYPNSSGRALVKGRHDVLGLVWPLEVEGVAAPFAQRVLAALTQQLVSHDLDLLICPVDRRQPDTMEHARRTIQRSRCDGWILLYPRPDDLLIRSLRASRKPVICLMGGLSACPEWKAITLDQHAWMEDALARLKKSGARRVLFLGCRAQEPDHEERLEVFKALARQYFGKQVWILPGWPCQPDEVGALLKAEKIDAVIGVDDTAALIAAEACRRGRLEIPSQVQIIGIDDSAEAARATPSLASYRQPLDEMTEAAVALAMGNRVRSRKFTATFVPGGSVRTASET